VKTRYHIDITRNALSELFSANALYFITAANVAQDNLAGQVGHPEYHFDDGNIAAGFAYMDSQRAAVVNALRSSAKIPAWQAFGRLTHAAQDFYAHTNYIPLLKKKRRRRGQRASSLDTEVLDSSRLTSGRMYLLDYAASIPGLRRVARRFLPEDSHARMNLDDPSQGELFSLAMEAATRRTIFEYSVLVVRILEEAGETAVDMFHDLPPLAEGHVT
jgi:hypothetical protein